MLLWLGGLAACAPGTHDQAPEAVLGASPLDPEVQPLPSGWAGRVLFTEERSQPYFRVWSLDLEHGSMELAFTVEPGGFLFDFAQAADGTLALAYVAPAREGPTDYTTASLFLSHHAGAPTPWIEAEAGEVLSEPCWTPDGQWLYFTRGRTDGSVPLTLERVRKGADVPEFVAHGRSPAISADGSQLAFVHVNPATGDTQLRIHRLRSMEPRASFDSEGFHDLGNPTFGPDGRQLYFSALRGADAKHGGSHGEFVDWYRVPVEGGVPTLFAEAERVYAGALAPEGAGLVYSTGEGLVLAPMSGAPPELLVKSRAIRALGSGAPPSPNAR